MVCLDVFPTLRLVCSRIRQNVWATSDIESASSDPNRLYKSDKSHIAGLPHNLFYSKSFNAKIFSIPYKISIVKISHGKVWKDEVLCAKYRPPIVNHIIVWCLIWLSQKFAAHIKNFDTCAKVADYRKGKDKNLRLGLLETVIPKRGQSGRATYPKPIETNPVVFRYWRYRNL